MTNSRQKGKRGELEFAHLLTDAGFPARRGQQFKGGADSPDVICESLPYHWEVKRVQSLNLHKAMHQAKDEAPPNAPPVVAHRRNGEPWLITMDFQDWIEMARELASWEQWKQMKR